MRLPAARIVRVGVHPGTDTASHGFEQLITVDAALQRALLTNYGAGGYLIKGKTSGSTTESKADAVAGPTPFNFLSADAR